MEWQPLWDDGPLIAGHALAALGAIALGLWQLMAPKGTVRHRIVGWIWVVALAAVAISSFWINEFRTWGPFSPIHVLSVVALVSLVSGIAAARSGRTESHRRTMLSLYALALVLTGLFTLLPGRTMHAVLFGG